ncbi:MAG: hypothetical protein N2376_11870, partial [Clostridia bacterium]|nr:hypothetical protein [Clostridia bacterium]
VRYCGFIDALLSMLDVDKEFPPISRNDFEEMLSGYISQFPRLVTDCLSDIGFNGAQLDYIILTGGHSQWYFTNEILDGTLTRFGNPSLPKIQADPRRIIKLSRPQETVALGLVFQRITIMDGIVCKKCGNKNPVYAKFCGYCGNIHTTEPFKVKAQEAPKERAQAPHAGASKSTATGSASNVSSAEHSAKEGASKGFSAKPSDRSSFSGAFANGHEAGAGSLKTAPEPEKFCGFCGKKIAANAEFCGFCGKDLRKAAPLKGYSLTIARETQFVCAACPYKVVVEGVDYGTLNVGQSRVVSSSSQVVTVDIVCTMIMMTQHRVRLKLKLGNSPRVDFKLLYGG